MTEHVWDPGTTGAMQICRRCGAVAELNDPPSAFVYSRPCTDAPNVIGMTLRRAKQIRDRRAQERDIAAFNAARSGIVIEKFDGTRATITTDEPA